MEEELVQIFQVASKAADAAAVRLGSDGGEADESRCIKALNHLKTFPVTSQVLLSTQVGRGIRRLTKHPKKKIQDFASDLMQIWKQIVTEESKGRKRKEAEDDKSSTKVGSNNMVKKDSNVRGEEVSETTALKARKIEQNGAPNSRDVEKKLGYVALNKPASNPRHQKSTHLVKCNDPVRDKVRELLYEALSKVFSEADEGMVEEVNACDPAKVAVSVESVLFAKWGRISGSHKIKYRSVMFNIKDQSNPDFRRKVLLGHVKPERLLNMTSQEMASDYRRKENDQIKEKAMFECELGAAPKATTDQFKCGRCGQRKCAYYQMQTRSADEPMTTYVTCVNCNNHWKFC